MKIKEVLYTMEKNESDRKLMLELTKGGEE
jgi:hypothetical protein